MCARYLADDLEFKRDFKRVNGRLPQVGGFILSHTRLKVGLASGFRATPALFQNGKQNAHDLVQTRCRCPLRGTAVFASRRLRSGDKRHGHASAKDAPARTPSSRAPGDSRPNVADEVDAAHTAHHIRPRAP